MRGHLFVELCRQPHKEAVSRPSALGTKKAPVYSYAKKSEPLSLLSSPRLYGHLATHLISIMNSGKARRATCTMVLAVAGVPP